MALFSGSSRPRTFEFPGPRDRVAIVGKTGSGKSTFALWMFAESADFDKKPWVLIDYKGEDIINQMLALHLAKRIELADALPEKPGIYVLSPHPHQTGEMGDWLWMVWKRGKIGLLFDELYMVPEFKGAAGTGGPLKSILTQGRSKEIPVYGLSQRPVDVNKHVFTEAQFIVEFRLKNRADRDRIAEYLPDDEPLFRQNKTLPDHWSKYWDDKRNVALLLKPSPDAPAILDIIENRVDKMRTNRKI